MSAMAPSKSSTTRKFWLHRPFWILSLAIFLNAYSYGVAAVSTTWLSTSESWSLWHLISAPGGLIIGILSGGIAADRIGRTRLLRWTPIGYVIGASILLMSHSHFLTAWGCLALVITAGMESTTVLALAQELLPKPVRKNAFYLTMNFSNLGGMALAILTAAIPQKSMHRQLMISLIPLVLAPLSFWLRRRLPESARWLHAMKSAAKNNKPFYATLRFTVSILFSYTNATGFALATYALGIKVYPTQFARFLILSTAGAFVAGLASPLFAKIPVSRLLLFSYGSTFLFALALWIHPTIHWAPWTGLSIGTGVAFLAENEFKTSAWPSRIRGRVTAWERVGGQLGYLITLIAVQKQSFPKFTQTLGWIWMVGLVAAVIWILSVRRSTVVQGHCKTR